MKRPLRLFLTLIVVANCLAAAQHPKVADDSIGAVPLTHWVPSPTGYGKDEKPANVDVPSPDGKKMFSVREGENGERMIEVKVGGKQVAHHIEYENQPYLLWAPDSSAFLIGFTDAGSYDGWQMKLFVFRGATLREYEDLGRAAKLDVARSFPPCRRGSQLNLDDCNVRNFAETLNVFPLAWLDGHTLAISVEVPCSTAYGPNFCHFKVFEVKVPAGYILHSYTAKQARARYPQLRKTKNDSQSSNAAE